MYLLILESIGTSELILIAVVALIVFGPRKLPQMVKTIGKTMGEFRSATNEFKSTWAREAALEEEVAPQKTNSTVTIPVNGEKITDKNTVPVLPGSPIPVPQVRELSADDLAQAFPDKNIRRKEDTVSDAVTIASAPTKRDWL